MSTIQGMTADFRDSFAALLLVYALFLLCVRNIYVVVRVLTSPELVSNYVLPILCFIVNVIAFAEAALAMIRKVVPGALPCVAISVIENIGFLVGMPAIYAILILKVYYISGKLCFVLYCGMPLVLLCSSLGAYLMSFGDRTAVDTPLRCDTYFSPCFVTSFLGLTIATSTFVNGVFLYLIFKARRNSSHSAVKEGLDLLFQDGIIYTILVATADSLSMFFVLRYPSWSNVIFGATYLVAATLLIQQLKHAQVLRTKRLLGSFRLLAK